MSDIQRQIAAEFKLEPGQVKTVMNLIEQGNTIPFIARYRKEATGGINDLELRELDERIDYLKKLEARKVEVIDLIDKQGSLSPELRAKIESASIMQSVEDLYKPFKKKRTTRASKARDAGLEPLALQILAQGQTQNKPLVVAAAYVCDTGSYTTPETALQGALDIIAEMISDDAEHRAFLRRITRQRGLLVSEAICKDEKASYSAYYGYSEPLSRIPNHRILALNRGEKEEKLRVKVQMDSAYAVEQLERRIVKRPSVFSEVLRTSIEDSYKRLIAPSLEREMRAELSERANSEAIKVFAQNTEKLLLQRPVRNARIIAIDPGYRTGCKLAVLDEYGNLLDYTTIYPTPPRSEVKKSKEKLAYFTEKHHINLIAVGNGTASRETEEFVASYIEESNAALQYTIVNEAGASVYSASKLASEEYPDLDVSTRGAMSLGRRLQDPLAELVKISPKSIGVGQYQHDMNQSALENALANVVESVVNRVGVDLNTASASLLTYVAGINASVAKNIVSYREEQGAFTDRRELKKVPGLGAKAFQNCAGFLRISGGHNPLDATSVHPESYPIAREVLKRCDTKLEELTNEGIQGIEEALGDVSGLALELEVGLPTLKDIVSELEKPGRDPRDEAPEVVFSRNIRSFDDLETGMELSGTVRNVVDFGAFIDIGVEQDGLVHISKMADRFIKHPSEVVSLGDTVRVWVLDKDEERKRISLTMIKGS